MTETSWNSLEIVKLAVSALTPLTITGIGVYIHKLTKKYEHTQWKNQKLIEKKLSIYDQLAPLLNDNLCYFTYVGNWKDQTPSDVIASKRKIDKIIHLSSPLFSDEFFDACMRFQDLCFETYNGWGQDARLRTRYDRRIDAFGAKWNSDWAKNFSDSTVDPVKIRAAYKEVMSKFSEEIGIANTQREATSSSAARVFIKAKPRHVKADGGKEKVGF